MQKARNRRKDLGAMMFPAWVSTPPQNNPAYYYGVGMVKGKDPIAAEKAKLRALQDLSSRIFVTVDSTQTETRSTSQKNTFFGSFKDKQENDSEIEVSSYLSDIPGVSVRRLEHEDGITFCLVQLDRMVLQDFYWRQLESYLSEMSYMQPNSYYFNEKSTSFKAKLNKARNLGVYVFTFEKAYNALKYKPAVKPTTFERRPSQRQP
jgi:hypothetical protein